jgi:hypothetical protein
MVDVDPVSLTQTWRSSHGDMSDEEWKLITHVSMACPPFLRTWNRLRLHHLKLPDNPTHPAAIPTSTSINYPNSL